MLTTLAGRLAKVPLALGSPAGITVHGEVIDDLGTESRGGEIVVRNIFAGIRVAVMRRDSDAALIGGRPGGFPGIDAGV